MDARLLTYEETVILAKYSKPCIVWEEFRIFDEEGCLIETGEPTMPCMIYNGALIDEDGKGPLWGPEDYNSIMRLWTDEPTEAQRKEAKWSD